LQISVSTQETANIAITLRVMNAFMVPMFGFGMKPHPGLHHGYPPGVRENGGQYTHSGFMGRHGFCSKGNGRRAVEVLQMLNPIEHAHTPEDYGIKRSPTQWPTYVLTFRYGRTEYRIEVQNGGEPSEQEFKLEDDHKSHTIRISTDRRPSRKMPDTSGAPSVVA
jgi:cellobiose phosphorylase